MIKRHLTQQQRGALETLQQLNGVPGLSLRLRNIALETVHSLMRQKLAVEGDDALYRVTEAGAEALKTGLYERHPILLRTPAPPKPPRFQVLPAPPARQGA